ncbi:MAG: DUF4167 domain-containing protein [Rhodospirillales bacterium]
MKQHPQGNRRPRRPNNGRRGPQNVRSQTFESNGPECRIRGTAQQVLEKYLTMGRDASSAGEHIQAEALYQHAEHYFRLLNSDPNYQQNRNNGDQERPTPANNDQASYSNEDAPSAEPAGMGEQPTGLGEQPVMNGPPQSSASGSSGASSAPSASGSSSAPSASGSSGAPSAPAPAPASSGGGREIPISQGSGEKENPGGEVKRRRGRPPKAVAEAPAE